MNRTSHLRLKPPERFRFSCRRWLGAMTLGVLLSACTYAIVERNAPELEKRYFLTEDLVLTDTLSQTPGFATGLKLVPYAMPRSQFDILKSMDYDSQPEGEMTDRGTIPSESLVQVLVMFIGRSPGGDVRLAEVQFTDPVTGERMTTYVVWDEIAPTLEEVQRPLHQFGVLETCVCSSPVQLATDPRPASRTTPNSPCFSPRKSVSLP